MIENNAIEIPLNLSVDHIPSQIETINRIGTPRVATGYNSNETIRFFSTNHASESLKNISNQILFDKEIKTLVSKNFNLFSSSNDNRHHDFIEWSLFGRNLTKKRAEFREQIDLYKTYNNQHHSVTKMIIEITSYYLDEYLISQECFSQDRKDEIKFYFQKSIEEQNYLKRFIQVYTSSTIFHRILNKHLASYILDYFHIPSYSSSPTKYRLINCLVHIVTLVINHPDIHLYEYKGITYRGLLVTEDELKNYYLNNQVLNRSFLSTSKNRTVALTYAGYRDKDLSEDTLDNQNSTQISVLFKFLIKQNRTGIDIQQISTIRDDEEVLILPFSVFEVKRRRKRTNKNSTMLLEIDLEECEDNEQIDDTQKENELLVNRQPRTKGRKKVATQKSLCMIICLFIMLTLIVIIKTTMKSNNESKNDVRRKTSRANNGQDIESSNPVWKQVGITVAGGNGPGNRSDQLFLPAGISIDTNETIYIADYENHRIVEWKLNATNGRIIVGRNGEGNQTNQLKYPVNVIVDQENNFLIISDVGNRRVVRWSRDDYIVGQILISNITCSGLAMDNNGFLYVSDTEKNEVRRWKQGRKDEIVAGGHGQGNQLNQFDNPIFIFVDDDYSLYVSDEYNHRVTKWTKDAKEGIVVAGGNNQGNSLAQLFSPHGIILDSFGQIYVADYYNHRVMRWCKGDKQGVVVVGENKHLFNQIHSPAGLTFDQQGNLYVVDHWNHQVQKFEIDYNENNALE